MADLAGCIVSLHPRRSFCSVVLAMLLTLGQLGLLGASEPPGWSALLSRRAGSVRLDLGVPRARG